MEKWALILSGVDGAREHSIDIELDRDCALKHAETEWLLYASVIKPDNGLLPDQRWPEPAFCRLHVGRISNDWVAIWNHWELLVVSFSQGKLSSDSRGFDRGGIYCTYRLQLIVHIFCQKWFFIKLPLQYISVQLTTSDHSLWWWLRAEQTTRPYVDEWWVHWHIHVVNIHVLPRPNDLMVLLWCGIHMLLQIYVNCIVDVYI